jgi:parallel beta-helix repeat protein
MRLNNDGVTATGFVFVPPISAGGGATIPVTNNALKGDGTGNGAAVTGTPTNCVLVNGTSAACGTPGALTQSQVCSIESFSPAGDGVTNDAPAFTAAQAVCKQIQLSANKNYAITTPLTLTSGVTFVGGATMIANNAALTMNGAVIAPTIRAFTISGTGTVSIGGSTPDVYAEWFGAARDSTTDDTLAIQQAYNSRTPFSGTLRLLAGGYKTTATLNFSTSFVNVIGAGGLTTEIKYANATGNIIDIVGTPGSSVNCASNAVFWQFFAQFGVVRAVMATSGDGFNMNGACWNQFDHVYSLNNINNWHLQGSANTTFNACQSNWSITTSTTRNGFFLDSTVIGNGNASTIISGHTVSNGGGPSGGTGLLIQGACIADVFVESFETANLFDTVRIISTASTTPTLNTCNSDLHFNQVIGDQINGSGFFIQDVVGGSVPSIIITNSHFQSGGANAGVQILNSSGVVVANNEFQDRGSPCVFIQGAGSNTITGNTFQACNEGVQLNGSGSNVIGNNIFNSGVAGQTDAFVRLGGGSFSNQIVNNTFTGFATFGIIITASDLANNVFPNTFNPANITSPLSNSSGKGNYVSGPGYSNPTISSGCGTMDASSTNAAGFFISTAVTCTGVLAWDLSRMGPASKFLNCTYKDESTPADTLNQTSSTTAQSSFTGTTVIGDKITYKCEAY